MKTAAHTLLASLGLIIACATAIALLPFETWWVRMLDFPRLQIALLGSAILLLWLTLWKSARWWSAAVWVVTLAAVIYQGVRIFPYTPLSTTELAQASPSPEVTLSILVANVLRENRDAQALLALVNEHDPDIVLLIETDAWWMNAMQPIEAARPHTVRRPLDNSYGMMLYSRLPLREPLVRELTEPGVPSVRAVIDLPGGASVTFHGVHPAPPVPGLADNSLPRDAELVQIAREVAKTQGPAIVAGDFNDVPWSDTTALFQRLSGLLDPRAGRGLFSTYHADYFFARWPLDHIFLSEEFLLVAMQRLPSIGSDHFPMLVTAEYAPREQSLNDPPPPPDQDALEDGADKVQDQREDD